MAMSRKSSISRRQFVKALAAAGAAGPLLLTSRLYSADPPPSERINLGFIGVGTMGRGHLGAFLGRKEVQVVAVCDVVAERRDAAKKTVDDHYGKQKGKDDFKGCKAFNDFRDLLALKEIDAVVIATPDHWHAIPCVAAARAKKHIFCEKPLTLTLAEGRIVTKEAKKNDIVFQTGSQQRSEFGGMFRTAAEYVRSGRIGKLKTIRIGVGDPNVPCDLPEQDVPEGTDWDMWLGQAPKRGYNEILCPKGVHNHFPAWRNYREYAGGGLADMGAHHFDIAQWALDMDNSGPVKIEPPGGKEKTGLKYTYANGVEMFHGGPSGCTFEGSEGTIYVDRDKLESKPKAILEQSLGEKDVKLYKADDHRKNWLECIVSKKVTICPAEVGHRSASVCHLGNLGYQLRRVLKWDPEKERFVDDEEANKLVSREMRKPWKLEG
jgi:predicted dehydrogenase